MTTVVNLHEAIVIVGAGQAGAVAARALREAGHAGSITMIGREPHRPYERPPLSKAVLADGPEPRIDVLADEAWDRLGITLHREAVVQQIDMASRSVLLADGRRIAFDQCLLATGGSARPLPGLPPEHPRVHLLRSLEDARRLRAALGEANGFGVIGGGFLGLEVATAIRQRGGRVAVIESAAGLLPRALPPAAATWLEGRVLAQGIALHLNTRPTAIRLPDDPADPITIDLMGLGTTLSVDHLIVAIGLVPDVDLARAAGAQIDPDNGGVRVDAAGRTSLPGLFAAGDCASQPRADGIHRRIESWQNANEQARAVAAGMLGQPLPEPAFPWFWTDTVGCNLQMLGHARPGLELVLRGDLSEPTPKAVWLGLDDGRPIFGLAVNAGTDLRIIRPLFERGICIDPAVFSNPATALRTWVRTLTP